MPTPELGLDWYLLLGGDHSVSRGDRVLQEDRVLRGDRVLREDRVLRGDGALRGGSEGACMD